MTTQEGKKAEAFRLELSLIFPFFRSFLDDEFDAEIQYFVEDPIFDLRTMNRVGLGIQEATRRIVSNYPDIINEDGSVVTNSPLSDIIFNLIVRLLELSKSLQFLIKAEELGGSAASM